MKRNGELPKEKPVELEQFVDRWRHKILGLIVEGMTCSDREMKARMIMNSVRLSEDWLRQMYDELMNGKPSPGK